MKTIQIICFAILAAFVAIPAEASSSTPFRILGELEQACVTGGSQLERHQAEAGYELVLKHDGVSAWIQPATGNWMFLRADAYKWCVFAMGNPMHGEIPV